MNKEIFIERYKLFAGSTDTIQLPINTILAYEEFVNKDIEDTTIDDIKYYMKHLIDTKSNKYNNLIHIARYYYYVDMKEHYIQMTRYFNSLGVLEHIIDRISLYEDEPVVTDIVSKLELPPFGTDPDELPRYVKRFLNIMNENISEVQCERILAGNNHRIPKSSFEQEVEYYSKAESLEAYLKDRHQRKVQELQDHYNQNKIWFEQIITPEVIEFVKNNPEILSGVLKNDTLYVTKIPYDITHYLNTDDDVMKRYYACHCSFVRENIRNQQYDISKQWCYCSGGFAKLPFETILGEELNVTLIQSPLDGDPLCRFAIDLSNVDYK